MDSLDPGSDERGPVHIVVPLTEHSPDRPLAISEHRWNSLMIEERNEVLERMGFLAMRGLRPNDAYRKAVATMDYDMQLLRDDEMETQWSVFQTVARIFPQPWRKVDGSYTSRITQMAKAVEVTGRALAGLDGYLEEDFQALDPVVGPTEAITLMREALRRRDLIVSFQTAAFLAQSDPLPESRESADDRGIESRSVDRTTP